MDLITIDVSQAPNEAVQPGAYVHLIGGGIPLDEVAELAGTISYEVLTRLGPRLRRVYVNQMSDLGSQTPDVRSARASPRAVRSDI
jgi:hypothetical protein